jgi:uncharacterized protein (TIGR00369 family)
MTDPISPLPLNLTKNPFLESLDLKFLGFEKESALFELAVAEKHLRSLGIMHGGVACTLLDTAMGTACAAVAPEGYFAVTAQLNINFTRPAWPEEVLTIKGTRLHLGKSTVVCRGEILTAKGELIACSSGTFLYIPKPAGTAMAKNP